MSSEHPDPLLRLRERLDSAEREIERKDQIIAALQKRLFGSKSERIDPNQGQLEFGEEVLGKAEPLPPTHADGEGGPEEESAKTGTRKSRRSKRDLLPENLPVIVEEVTIPDEVAADPEAWVEISEDYHDELEAIKAALYWKRKTRKKFKRKGDRSQPPVIAPAPEPSIPGTMVGPDLMAMIIADKYSDHLPHYRQSDRFLRRFGADLSRQTINKWTHAAAEFLAPIGTAIRQELQEAEVLQIDESPMDYLSPGLGRTALGYLWFYRDAVAGTIYCDWQLGRGHEAMLGILGLGDESASMPNLELIQCDGFSAYKALVARYPDIVLGACLAHIRRKFFEAQEQSPSVIAPILETIAGLYRVERSLRHSGAPPGCRELVRRSRSRPLLDRLKRQILTERDQHFPKSKLGEAITYALGQWEQFERYQFDGRLAIDNNDAENAIRPAKLGLKNYLFIGNAEAGASSALFYTLLGNCKAQGIDLELYLGEVLDRLTLSTTPEEAAELTPARLAETIRRRQPRPGNRGRIERDLETGSAAA